MRCSQSVAKLERSEALARELRFAHGSNINSHDESCGKHEANGCCAKSLAAKTGRAEAGEFWSQISLYSTEASNE
jgi:hypothetical protein